MSADELRRAAATVREVAEKATPGPWRALCDGYGDTSGGSSEEERRDLLWVRSGETNAGDVVSTYGNWSEQSEFDVRLIALLHPGVGKALADWLDETATFAETNTGDWKIDPDGCVAALARAILGGSS